MDAELIAEKIVQCFNIYVVKYRERFYEIIEKNPDRAEEIKQNMIIDNIYFRRMLFDTNFKKYMMKNLDTAFKDGEITVDSIKQLLVSIIDELERPTEDFFDIFTKPSNKLPIIDLGVIENHTHEIIKIAETKSLKQSFESLPRKDIDFLKKIIKMIEPDTSLYRALEDLIIEYSSSIFYSRYYEKGEVSNFLMYNINPFIRATLNNQKNLVENQLKQQTLLMLCPEYYSNLESITDLVFQALKELVNLPESLRNNFLSMQSIHIMSILMSLIFIRKSYEDKLKILNGLYEFTLNTHDLQLLNEMTQNTNSFNFLPETFKIKIPKNKESKFGFFYLLTQDLLKMELYPQSLMISQFLYENEEDPYKKILALDNVATGYRDIREYDEAIKVYSEVLEYYEKNREHYRAFVSKKNIAFCFFKKGKMKKAEEIYESLEVDLSKYTQEELIGVYLNLSYRQRLQYNFEKEDYYLGLILELLQPNDPRYQSTLNRSIELQKFFNLETLQYDSIILEAIERDINYTRNMEKATFHQSNLNIDVANYYIDAAYEDKEKDFDYYNFVLIEFILTHQWNRIKDVSELILKIKPNDIVGNYYMSIYYLSQKDDNNAFCHFQIAAEEMPNNNLNYMQEMEFLNNFLYFCCQLYTHEEIIRFIDVNFKDYELNPEGNKPKRNIIVSMGVNFISNYEKSLSRHIFKKFAEFEQTREAFNLYGSWAFRFKEFDIAKESFEKVLEFSPNDIDTLRKLAQVCLILNQFEESINHISHAISHLSDDEKQSFESFREYIITIRDYKIRFESLSFEDVKIVFNTVEYSLKTLNPNEKIEFGNIITEISKGIELLLGTTLGQLIYSFIALKYPKIPQDIIRGDKRRGIYSLNPMLLNFLNDPKEHNMTLGNWKYILFGVKDKIDPRNPLMNEIYYFIENNHKFTNEIIKKVLDLCTTIIDDRNKGTHKRLYSKDEVENLLKIITPDLNYLIEQLK